MALLFPSLWALSGLLSIIKLGRDGDGEQRLLGRRESQWMADGCHLGILFMWNWTSLQRAGVQRDWEREKWLENKQQKVLTTRTNRGGHNCDLGPVKSLKVNWEYRISDLRTAYKTLSWWGEGSTEPRAGLVTSHLKKNLSLFTLYLFKFRFVSEKWMEGPMNYWAWKVQCDGWEKQGCG